MSCFATRSYAGGAIILPALFANPFEPTGRPAMAIVLAVLFFLTLLVGCESEPELKPTPEVEAKLKVEMRPATREPDWGAFGEVDPARRARLVRSWDLLLKARPGRKIGDPEEEFRFRRTLEAASAALSADRREACAVGVDLLQKTKDDFERLLIATTVHGLEARKGEPFLLWAMANSRSIDPLFSPLLRIATRLAAKRQPEYLPAIFLILRTRDGFEYLPQENWTIPTPECVFYVLGRYGRDVLPYLYPKLNDPDPYVRRNAAFALGYFVEEDLKPVFLEKIKARDIGSGGAAVALAGLGDTDTVEAIATLLSAPEPDTRYWAAYALSEIGARRAVRFLQLALVDERHDRTRDAMEAAVEYLDSDGNRFGRGARRLDQGELTAALRRAVRNGGLGVDVEEVAVSASAADVSVMEAIRIQTLGSLTAEGNRAFREWTYAIRYVKRIARVRRMRMAE